jgi:Amt family ammonium transporter
MLTAVKATVGLRVSIEEEIAGLEFEEHGSSAYPDLAPVLPSMGGTLSVGAGAIAGD